MFTELPNEIIILIAKYDVTPLALIIVSNKIYDLLNKKQIQTKNTITICHYTLLEKMYIKDFKYVVIKSIKKRIRKLKPHNIYVYWFNKVGDRQCGCKYKDVYKFDKGHIIHEISIRLIECNDALSHIYNKHLDIGMASIMEMNMIPRYRRHTNYAIEN